jgi:hypothetical protein
VKQPSAGGANAAGVRFIEPLTKAVQSSGRNFQSYAMNDILRDRIELDLIERLDRVRDDHEQAHNHELAGLRVLINNALRAAADYLVQLRKERLGL